MKKLLFVFTMMFLPMIAGAENVEIGGINYQLIAKNKQATVIKKRSGYYSGNVVIPASVTYEGAIYSVTSIGEHAFSNGSSDSPYNKSLTSVTIPNTITSIGSEAFFYRTGLTAVHISDIAAWCKISFSTPYNPYSNPLYYAHHLFLNGEEIKDLVIPNSVTYISNHAFYGCSGLSSVTIPNSVTSIGSFAFNSCSGLTSVTIPNSVTSIGLCAFHGCGGLTSVTIPNSVTSIERSTFGYCRSLTSVTIGNSVTSIGEDAFYYCSDLTSVTIPNSVTSIEKSAFSYCSGLTSVTIGNGVTNIGDYTFSSCSGLTSVTIPNSVTSIGKGAFKSCSGLTSVTIGSGEKNINSQAFANCKELTDVYCLAENVPYANYDVFQDSYIDYATLHVPTVSVDAYKAIEPWKYFKTIMGLDGTMPEEPETPKCATPTISYGGKRLTFNCETEGVEYVYEIKDADIKKGYDSEVSLSATYEISVYATKAGWENSNVATATLVWGTATFTETTPEESAVRTLTRDVPALVTTHGGTIAVQSEADGLPVAVYAADGQLYGSSIVSNGHAIVSTNLQPGTIAIVKIGQKAVKVMM